MNLKPRTVLITLSIFFLVLGLAFYFCPRDTSLDGMHESGRVVSNDGTVHRFFEPDAP